MSCGRMCNYLSALCPSLFVRQRVLFDFCRRQLFLKVMALLYEPYEESKFHFYNRFANFLH